MTAWWYSTKYCNSFIISKVYFHMSFNFATSDIVDNFQQVFPYSDIYNNYSINCLNIHLNALNNKVCTLQDQTTLLRRYVICVRTAQHLYPSMFFCLFACLFCFHVFLYFRKEVIIRVYLVNGIKTTTFDHVNACCCCFRSKCNMILITCFDNLALNVAAKWSCCMFTW